MSEFLEEVLKEGYGEFDKAVKHLSEQLSKIRAGKASPVMLDGIMVEYYGTPTLLSQVANITISDSRTLSIQPWEKSMLDEIARGITNANLGLNPQNNGELIIINVPVLTEERRIDLVKRSKAEGEHAKVSIRNQRKEAIDFIKGLKEDGLSEDIAKRGEDEVQKVVDNFTAKVDSLIDAKEKDIMTV